MKLNFLTIFLSLVYAINVYAQADLTIPNRALDGDIKLQVNDGGVPTDALTIDGASGDINIDSSELLIKDATEQTKIILQSEDTADSPRLEFIRGLGLFGVNSTDWALESNAGALNFITNGSGGTALTMDFDGDVEIANGNLAIGTESQAMSGNRGLTLHGDVAGVPRLQFTNPTSGEAEFDGADITYSTDMLMTVREATGDIGFRTNSLTRMVIDNAGRIGINETNPTVGELQAFSADQTIAYWVRNNASSVGFESYEIAGVGNIGSVTRNGGGSAVLYNTTSDERLKTNILDLENSLNIVKKIKPKSFNWLNNDYEDIGFIAQELYEVYPQAVHVGGDDPIKEPWAVDYGKLTPILIKAIQEQQEQIEELKRLISRIK